MRETTIYHGVIVNLLFRTTELVTGEYLEQKPQREDVSNFSYVRWFWQLDDTEYGILCAELLALVYENNIIKMFQKLDKTSPSKFADYVKKVKGIS